MITIKNFIFLSILAFIFTIFFYANNVAWTFLTSLIFAYILEPTTSYMTEKLKLNHNISSSIVIIIFISFLFIIFSILIPTIYNQLSLLIIKIPSYQTKFQEEIIPNLLKTIKEYSPELSNHVSNLLGEMFLNLDKFIQKYLIIIWNYLISSFFTFSLVLLIPVLLIYFLKDWHIIRNNINKFLNKSGLKEVNFLLKDINILLSAYIKGTLTVCIILSIFYISALKIYGAEFSVIMGICSGFSILLPIIGPTIAGLVAMIIDYLTNGFGYNILIVFLIYLIGQSIETYILTPKIVGGKLGLHPLVIIFSVLVGSQILGFKGLLFAIPLAGIIRILFTHIIKRNFKFVNKNAPTRQNKIEKI